MPLPSTTVQTDNSVASDVTVAGKVGSDIVARDITVTLTNEKFNAMVAGIDVKGWFKNYPAGIKFNLKNAVEANAGTATISGTPEAISSNLIEIVIPAVNLVGNKDLPVTENNRAKFDITKKSSGHKPSESPTVTPTPTPAAPSTAQTVTASVNVSGNTVNAAVSNSAVTEAIKKDKDLAKNGPDIKVDSKAKADIEISIKKADVTKQSEEVKAMVGARPVYDLTVMAGKDAKVTSFGGGMATVSIPYTPAASEDANKLTVYYIDDNGVATEVINARYDSKLKAMVFDTDHFSVYAVGEKSAISSFMDIEGHWAKADIEYVVGKGLMNGVSESMFAPTTAMTRGMFVTVIGRMVGVDKAAYANTKFTDVNADMYYAPYIAWAVEKGIVKGMSETSFMPEAKVTREQMAVIMEGYAKVANITLTEKNAEMTFADEAMISTWAAGSIKAMQKAGILSGKENNIFDPKGTATRAEVAKVVHVLMTSK